MPPLLDKNFKHCNKFMLKKNLELQLSGSQINLTSRPQSIKKASLRSAKSVLIKRPMSATPLLGYSNRIKKSTPAWTRPQSADNCTGISRRNKLAARFDSQNSEEDQDLFRNFGRTYTLSSSNLLQSLMGSSSLDVPIDSDISITPSPRLTKADDAKDGIGELTNDENGEYRFFQERIGDKSVKDEVDDEKLLKSNKGSSSSLVAGLEPGLASKPPLPPTADPKAMKYNLSSWSLSTDPGGACGNGEEKVLNDDDIINLKFQRWFPDSVLNSSYTSVDEERKNKVNIDMKHLFSNPLEKPSNTEVSDCESFAGSRNSLSEGELSEESGIKIKSKGKDKKEKTERLYTSIPTQGKGSIRTNKSTIVRETKLSSESFVRNKNKTRLSQSEGTLVKKSIDTSKPGLLRLQKTSDKLKSADKKSLSSKNCQNSSAKIDRNDSTEVRGQETFHRDGFQYKSGFLVSNENVPQHSSDYDQRRSNPFTRPSTSTTSFSNNESLLYNTSTPINPEESYEFFPENSDAQSYIIDSDQDKVIKLKSDGRGNYSMYSATRVDNGDKSLVPCINIIDLSSNNEAKSTEFPVNLLDGNLKKRYLEVPKDIPIMSEVDPMCSSHIKNNGLKNYLDESHSYFNREALTSPLQDNFFSNADFSNAPLTSSSRSIIANFRHEDDGMRQYIQTSVAVSECLVKTVKGETCKGVGKIIHNNSVLNASTSLEPYIRNVGTEREDEMGGSTKCIDRTEKAQTSIEGSRLAEQGNSNCSPEVKSSTESSAFEKCHSSNSFVELKQSAEFAREDYRLQDFEMNQLRKNGMNTQPSLTKADYIDEIPERDNDCMSTYDDIVDILKVLEQEEEKHTTLKSINDGSLVSSSVRGGIDEGSTKTSRAILSYLDEVNRNSEISLKRNPQQTAVNSSSIFQINDNTNRNENCGSVRGRLGELLSIPSPELAQCVMNLSLELEENSEAKRVTEEQLKTLQATFEKYKSETKAALERHQKFIDQLINEKKQLSEKCANLIKDLESKQAQAVKVLEDRHAVELKKACEKQAASEKIKRERWIDLKTRKIKELTVKGLEPELNRMAVVHQEELSELRRAHQHQMEEAEAATARRLASARIQFETDKENALIQERDVMRRRLEQETTEMEKSYQDHRKRMMNELRAEREQIQRENAGIILEKEKELQKKLEKISQESHEKYEQQEKRFQEELERMRNVIEAEKEAWLTRQKSSYNEKEKLIREELKRERDRHIEVAIRKLESEASGREEAAENKLKREKERFDCELRDLENVHKELRDKLKQARTDLSLAEQQNSHLTSDLQQALGEVESLKSITEKLAREKHELHLSGEEEARKRVSELERELAQTRLTLREQINTVQSEKERELQQVYTRVREAITKKDDTISLMAKERDTALEQCTHLEKLLEQQRKQFIKRKVK